MLLYVSKTFDNETFKKDETGEWVIASNSEEAEQSPYRVATDDEELAKKIYSNDYDVIDSDDCYEGIPITQYHYCEGWNFAVMIEKEE